MQRRSAPRWFFAKLGRPTRKGDLLRSLVASEVEPYSATCPICLQAPALSAHAAGSVAEPEAGLISEHAIKVKASSVQSRTISAFRR